MGKVGGVSLKLLIIVIILGAIASLATLFIFAQTYRRRRRPSPPLPTVQPLAHHRHAAKYDNELLQSEPASPMYNSIPSSNTSVTPLTQAMDSPSPTPTPGFSSPPSNLSAVSLTSADSPNLTPSARSQAHNALTHKSRPLSMSSVTPSGSVSRRGSRSTLRGVPHGPHSQVEIILPTPLAPQVSRRASQGSFKTRHENTSSDRVSLADQWNAPRSLAPLAASPSPRHSRQMTAPPSSYVPPSNVPADSGSPAVPYADNPRRPTSRASSREGFRTG